MRTQNGWLRLLTSEYPPTPLQMKRSSAEHWELIAAIKKDLTEDQRHVIILRVFEGFSLRETAMIMGKTINHVKVIQNRALAALRKSMEHKEIGKRVSSPKIRKLSKALGL